MKADYLVFENEKIVERLAEIEEFRLTVIARVEELDTQKDEIAASL